MQNFQTSKLGDKIAIKLIQSISNNQIIGTVKYNEQYLLRLIFIILIHQEVILINDNDNLSKTDYISV